MASPPVFRADGLLLNVLGQATFNITLGTLDLNINFIVADIEDDALLGQDVLCSDELEPSDILFSKNVIISFGMAIPLLRQKQSTCC